MSMRREVRLGAAALAAAMAVIYFLIGLGFLRVVDVVEDDTSMLFFGLPAGAVFLVGAVLLVTQDRRVLWVAGVALQVFVIWGYFAVAPSRTPSYEVWGIMLRIIQVPLTLALVYLALRPALAGQPHPLVRRLSDRPLTHRKGDRR
jgi:hypothetical protein